MTRRQGQARSDHGIQIADRPASVLLDAGENIKALAEYLGHSDPGFTLRTYTHLMPNSEVRARRAIDAMFSVPEDDDQGEGGGANRGVNAARRKGRPPWLR